MSIPPDERPEDRALRQVFAALREEERGSAPPFQRLARPSERSAPGLRVPLAAGAAALVLWALWPATDPPELAPELPSAQLAWHSSTDFLLEIPGAQMLRSFPTGFGVGLLGDLDAKGGPR